MATQPITLDSDYTDTTVLQVVPRLPMFSSDSVRWENLLLHQHQQPSHKTPEYRIMAHTLSLYTGTQPVLAEQAAEGKLTQQHVTWGHLHLVPVGLEQSMSWNQEIEFINLYLSPDLVTQIAQELVNPDRVELIPQFAIEDPLIQQIILALQSELVAPNRLGTHLFAESSATMLAVRLLKKYAVFTPVIREYEDGLSSRKLNRVIEYIDAHLKDDIKLAELAQIADTSLYYFSRLFKQSVGMTPYQYITQQRVERAKLLLKQSNWELADIALECGFYDQSHFTKLFRNLWE